MPGKAENCLLLVGKLSTDVGAWKVNMRLVDACRVLMVVSESEMGHDVFIP